MDFRKGGFCRGPRLGNLEFDDERVQFTVIVLIVNDLMESIVPFECGILSRT